MADFFKTIKLTFEMSETKKYIDDLSYSNIVNLVQGEDATGADLIATCADEFQFIDIEIAELEKQLRNKKFRRESLLNAFSAVAKHLQRPLPLFVSREDYIIVITAENQVIINENVI